MGEYIQSSGISGYLCRATTPTGAALLLYPHVTGIIRQLREESEQIASEGVTTLVWDPYPGIDAPHTPREQLPVVADTTALAEGKVCLDYLLQTLGATQVGVIGFCMGGRMSLNLGAREERLSACVAYFPSLRNPPKPHELDAASEAEGIQCPVQVLYGAKDQVTSNATFARLQASLAKTGHPAMIHVYPSAGHGFTGWERQKDPGDHEATTLAWPQTIAFLKASLIKSRSE